MEATLDVRQLVLDQAFAYEQTDIPAGVTVDEFRHMRAQDARRTKFERSAARRGRLLAIFN